MVEFETTKMSSKGQVVIPLSFRKNIKEGDTFIVLKNNDQIILKPASTLEKQFAEDIEFAKRTEEAWQRFDKGEFKTLEFDDFIKEMKTW